MHLARADLDLERPALGPDDRRVQRLVHVELRHRDEVLEATRQRLPQRVDHADGAVAVLDRADDHPHRGQVVDLVELAALLGHLRVDRVEVLGAARDLRLDPELVELLGQVGARLVDVALALGALLGDEALDLVVLARVERLEGEVLELPLDRVDTEPVGDRRVDVERLARLVDLLLLRHRRDRAHVVQAIGELDQDDPDVRGHRHHHLAVVLGLRLVARLERQPGQLRDAVDEAGDLLAEGLVDLVQRGAGVLDGVVQQRRAQRLGVEPHARADLGHADRVDDEVLAGLTTLIGVVQAGVDERLLDPVAIDRDRRVRRRAPRRSRTDPRAGVARAPSARPARPRRACRTHRRGRPAAWDAISVEAEARPVRRSRPAGRLRHRRCVPWTHGSGASSEISAAQVSPAILISCCVRPVGRRALERRALDHPRPPGPADPGRG